MDVFKDLFTTTSGLALLAISAGALLYSGTLQRVITSDVFAVRQEYDFRNKDEVIAKSNPHNDPWGRGLTSIAFTNRHGRHAPKPQLIG